MQGDIMMFLRSWAAEPLRVGAIAPSGSSLAEIITREITPATGQVIELGPGTGVFTEKLIERGVRLQDLTLIEYGSEFAIHLQTRFPGVRVLWMDAARLKTADLGAKAPAGAVVSGLPLLGMPTRKVMSILSGAFTHLRPGGAFYQFTYAGRCPVPRPILDRLGLKATLVDHTLRNIPPASVYRITRRRAWHNLV
ncbi:rRNA adenine N-6-methyltransferase family protein [Hyphomicrobium sp. LHD-15]|uniref:class I SAM-dependent methyltransferase n=1 Tax=Hyphomicrobium sp. LHD-15 TaxID=3072142 RepID=UPI00280D8BEF|nr:rRNA adenine N-6-methyltransferase family protein [Hyphomicrobium sp. LHD-15]MDQ8700872.1 rRNA adenine N-6-methyltransferase family protein [Hyphomicrobium sp. LHD-15]